MFFILHSHTDIEKNNLASSILERGKFLNTKMPSAIPPPQAAAVFAEMTQQQQNQKSDGFNFNFGAALKGAKYRPYRAGDEAIEWCARNPVAGYGSHGTASGTSLLNRTVVIDGLK